MTVPGMRTVDLGVLNTATKYPSIPTYHELDTSNGHLTEPAIEFTGDVVVTEKVDGTNARIVQFPDGGYILGSREDLLYAKGDLIGDAAQGIVDALRHLADRLTPPEAGVRVLFLEVYGGRITGASRQYTGSQQVGFRLFDTAEIPDEVFGWSREHVSSWRKRGGQRFYTERELVAFSAAALGMSLVPRLATVPSEVLPTSVVGMNEFLGVLLPETRASLDDGAGGRPEGVVLRSLTRSTVAKARFVDYTRTLTPRQPKNRKKKQVAA